MTQTLPYLLAMSAIASQVVESRWVPDLEKRQDFKNAGSSSSSEKDSSTKASEPKSSSDDKKTTTKAAETTQAKKDTTTSNKPATTKAATTASEKKTDGTTAAATPTSSDNTANSTNGLSISGAVGATPVVSNTASPSPTTDNAQKSSSGTSGGTIGAIVAVVIVAVLGAAAFFVIRRRKRRNNLSNSRAANMQKQDPFTMGYGNQDPMPSYQDNSYSAQNNAYAANNNTYMMETTSPATTYNNTIPNNDMYNNNDNGGYASYDPNMGAPIAATNTGYHDNNAGYTDNTGFNNTNAAAYTDNSNAGYNADYANTAAVAATAATVGAAAGMVAANNALPQEQTQQQQVAEHTPSIGKYTVIATFVPTLSDELEIEVGDQIELIVEYDDGWCQGINVSKGQNKGVFPRHCIDQINHAPMHTGNIPDIERTKRVSSMYIN